MKYINNLKELRKKAGYTQDELAKILGISKRTLAYWEKGESTIKPDKAQQLAELFSVSMGYLLGFEEEKLEKSKKTIISQWKKESEALLKLGFILSDNDLDIISQLLHNMSDRNYTYLFSLIKHKDEFLTERLESEFLTFYKNNPDFITNTQKKHTEYLQNRNNSLDF